MTVEHARDITDEAFLSAVRRVQELRGGSWATRWDVQAVLSGREDYVAAMRVGDTAYSTGASTVDAYPKMPEFSVPEKVLLAKFRRVHGRGLVDGCACGCRGDIELTVAGAALLDETTVRA